MEDRGPEPDRTPEEFPVGPLGELPSMTLLSRMQQGDAAAREELVRRYWPRMQCWARGRLPAGARDLRDTGDLVQETMIAALQRLDEFVPEHDGALQAYLRTVILNRVRKLANRAQARGPMVEIHSGVQDPAPSPLEQAIGRDALERYERALLQLRPEDRHAIQLKVELDLPYPDIMRELGKPTVTAARMAVSRALARLAEAMHDA